MSELNLLSKYVSNIPWYYLYHPYNVIYYTNDAPEEAEGEGVRRQFLMAANEQLFSKQMGYFVQTGANGTYHLNPLIAQDPNREETAFTIGRILAFNIIHSKAIPFMVSRIIWQCIVGAATNCADLEAVDTEIYHATQMMIDYDIFEEDELNFTYDIVNPLDNTITNVELIEHGTQILVNDENKYEYAKKKLQWRLCEFESFPETMLGILRGLYSVIPMELLKLFSYAELECIVTGDTLTIGDWQQYSVYVDDNDANHPIVEWFWNILQDYATQQQILLTRTFEFATSMTRPPLGSCKHLDPRFQIRLFNNIHYPVAATCFNLIKLPRSVRSQEELRQRLEVSITYPQTFSIL